MATIKEDSEEKGEEGYLTPLWLEQRIGLARIPLELEANIVQ